MTQTSLSIEYLPLTFLWLITRDSLLDPFSGRGTAVIAARAPVVIVSALNSTRTVLIRFAPLASVRGSVRHSGFERTFLQLPRKIERWLTKLSPRRRTREARVTAMHPNFKVYKTIPGLQLSEVAGRATEGRYKNLTIRALPELCA